MSITLKDSRLIDACPPSISDDVNVRAICEALDPQFRELIDDINQVVIKPAIDDIEDDDLLDQLGWEFHVDFWDKSAPRHIKKTLIKSSLDWHTRKGTVDLIQEVCDLAFGPGVATIQEWFDYKVPFPPNYPIDDPGGEGTWHDRYRFRVLVTEDGPILDPESEARVREVIRHYKPLTRWDEGFVRQRNSTCAVFWAAAALSWKYVTIEAPIIADLEIERIEPERAPVSTTIDLDVYGHNFSPDSVIYYITTARPTTFIDENHLRSRFGTGAQALPRNVFVREENRLDSNIVILNVFLPEGDYPGQLPAD